MDIAKRGRPPVTRARVLTYWRKHGPCSIMQVCRVTGADRRYVQRMKNMGMLNLTA
jgi:hypothetical protein